MTKALLPPGWVKARLYHLLAPLVALVAVALFEQTWIGELLEDQTVNLRFRARAPFDPPADSRLVFVGIDQQSLDKFGRYPWPRTTMAHFLTTIAQANANPYAMTFDILYTEQSSNPADDVALGDAAGLLPNVTTGALSVRPSGVSRDLAVIKAAEEKTGVDLKHRGPTKPFTQIHGDAQKIRGSNIATLPVQPVREQSLFGFVNDEPSPVDFIRHTLPLLIRVGDQVYPSLALQTLCQMFNVDFDKVEVNVGKNVILKNASGKRWTIPVDERGDYLINYRRNSSFRSLSFGLLSTFLDDHLRNGAALPPECNIEKKTLMIGEAATGLTDLGPTPLQAESPLVYTHLNVINNVLKNDYLGFVPWYWVVIGWSLITWPTLLRLKDAPLVETIAMPIALVVLYTVIAFGIFGFWSLQIALAWPVLSYGALNFGAVVLRWREEQRGRQQLKQVFSQMLSPEVMGHLLDHPENIKMGGSKRAVTILFSDIRDYTKFSEGLEEEELVRQLNIYFERMVDCVKECGGTLHKFIGDAIMSVWGDIANVSMGAEKDAQNAVRSALMMRRRLRELNEERRGLNQTPLRIGIGLNHGDVLVGLIGASSRSEFTVMGDAVNTASRLEGITKEFKIDLAISESVRLLIGDGFLVRRVGLILLKNKTKPTVVYEVLAEKTALAESRMTAEAVMRYEEAFDHLLARRFAQAEAGFLACEKDYPDDHCVKMYLHASREFSAKPPPPEWDGRIVMETK
jgi:adenylate cyclase